MTPTEKNELLGKLIDTTFGRSSMARSSSGGSVKFQMVNDETLIVTYHCIGTFLTRQVPEVELKKYEDEGVKVVKAAVKMLKEEFKEASDKDLKLTLQDTKPHLDIVNVQPHISAKRTVHYRLVAFYKIG